MKHGFSNTVLHDIGKTKWARVDEMEIFSFNNYYDTDICCTELEQSNERCAVSILGTFMIFL